MARHDQGMKELQIDASPAEPGSYCHCLRVACHFESQLLFCLP